MEKTLINVGDYAVLMVANSNDAFSSDERELKREINEISFKGLTLFLDACEQMEELRGDEATSDGAKISAEKKSTLKSKSAPAGLSTLEFLSKVGTVKSAVTEVFLLVNEKPRTHEEALARDLKLVAKMETLS